MYCHSQVVVCVCFCFVQKKLTFFNISATIQDTNLKSGIYVHYQKGNLCDEQVILKNMFDKIISLFNLESILILMHQQQTAFENIVGKEEIARNNVCYTVR